MLPFVRVGPLLVQLPGLALLAGLWIGSDLVEKEAVRLRLNASAILNLIIYGLIAGLIGARLLYALEHLNAYLVSPLSLFALSGTALDGWGGLLVGLAVAILYGRSKALPLRHALDALAPGLAVFMIALGVANLLSGDGYGLPLDAPWAIYLWGAHRHPTQIYETLLAIGVLIAWRFASRTDAVPGSHFLLVTGLSAASRLFTEAFHADSAVALGGFRLAQVIALMVLAASFLLRHRWSADVAGKSESAPSGSK
jgi:phosphatidylglycerol---prolipoprotein diacylglyceryl transferase